MTVALQVMHAESLLALPTHVLEACSWQLVAPAERCNYMHAYAPGVRVSL
jgi:hypothetical protein